MKDSEFLEVSNLINLACCNHFKELIELGVDEQVAADRTFDVIYAIYHNKRCFDARDHLFQKQVLTAIKAKQERIKHA